MVDLVNNYAMSMWEHNVRNSDRLMLLLQKRSLIYKHSTSGPYYSFHLAGPFFPQLYIDWITVHSVAWFANTNRQNSDLSIGYSVVHSLDSPVDDKAGIKPNLSYLWYSPNSSSFSSSSTASKSSAALTSTSRSSSSSVSSSSSSSLL